MRGIDIYHGDSVNESSTLKTIPERAYKESDFVIVKATQGTSYKYTSFFHKMIKRVLKDGKLAGAYHYAAGNDPAKEADYFLSVVKPYLGKVILALDWEGKDNKQFGSKTWCKKFIDRVQAKTGIRCILYTGTDGCAQNAALAGKVPLWFAGYPKPMSQNWTVPKWKYSLGVWSYCEIWQYTSTNEKCDRNTSDITGKEWGTWYTPTTPGPDRHIQLLALYHEYIKRHGQKFINDYDKNITSFWHCRKRIKAGKTCGISCVVPNRWALYDMGITGRGGKSLISTHNGHFGDYYSGDVKKHFSLIKSGGPVGMTIKQAVDKGALHKGDIICYEGVTHISIYSGNGYKVYEGGSACVKDGHYPDGIKIDHKDNKRKISEILRWKTGTTTTKEQKPAPEAQTGILFQNGSASPSSSSVTSNTAIKKTADILLSQARSWIGCKESDSSHKKIIDLYNRYKPLPRGYKVQYTDAWCATFVSACAIACGYDDIIPLECSCAQMVAKAQQRGIWIEDESRTPRPGDIIMYDWQDSGKGDNKGAPDHVGIVERVQDGKITVIEGNYKDAVGRRIISVNGKNIRGYITPAYDAQTATQTAGSTQTKKNPATTKQPATEPGKGYTGTFPALPPRGYYKRGDGISTYTNYPTQLKRVQKLMNWIVGAGLEIDGKFGVKTEATVNKALGLCKQKQDGRFDQDLLDACKKHRK